MRRPPLWECRAGASYCIVKGCHRPLGEWERAKAARAVLLREPDFCSFCAKPLTERARLYGDRLATAYRTNYAEGCEVRA